MTTATLFHSMSFRDATAAMTFLEAVGFTRAAVYTDDAHPELVLHAQYDWGDHGAVMFGSRGPDRPPDDGAGFVDSAGRGQCYCVVDSDAEVDAVHERAIAAGATSVREPADQDYGGRGCTVRDAEGNQWSFGSFRGD